jgi:L-fuconolactonase
VSWVLDHAGTPRVACTLSGLVTEAGEDWTPASPAPDADHVLEAFGADQVMFGYGLRAF